MKALLRISFFAVVALSRLDEVFGKCQERYSRFSKEHTGCKPPNPECQVDDRGLKPGDIEEILRLHNEIRSRLAKGEETKYNVPKAADMLQLVWDDELAELAQAHADQCTDDHDCKQCRRSKNFEVGQNIYKTEVSQPERDYEAAVKSFYDEVEFFHPSWLSSFSPFKASGPVGHFTQLAWARSWRVGCGYVAFKEEDSVSEIFVCDYGPTGNYLNQPIFIEGEPCSKCPENTCCGSACSQSPNYDGLCQVKEGKIPVYPHPKDGMLYHCDFTNEDVCKLVVPKGGIPWTTEDTLSGKHYTVVLKAGETAKFGVKTSFPKKPGACLKFAYTKGPNVAGTGGQNLANQIYTFVGSRMSPKVVLMDSDKLMVHNMNLKFPRAFKFEVSMSVPKGSSDQYFDIQEFYISLKDCK